MIDVLATNLVFQPLHLSRNRLEVLIDPADTTLPDRSGLRYALTLLVPVFPQSNDFTELTTLIARERPPLMVGGARRYDGAQFRIDEVLDGFLDAQKPLLGQVTMSLVASQTMPFRRKEVVTGGQPAVNTTQLQPAEWTFKGGLTNEDYNAWQTGFFDRYLRDARQFLTWQPAVKTVSLYQKEYLNFLLNFSPLPTLIKRRIEVSYPDGRVDTRTTDTLKDAAMMQVLTVPAGMEANGLGYDVASYKVWLSDADDKRLSEVRSYVVDSSYKAQERFILFENSLGGYDTLRLLGQGEWSTSVRRQTVQTDQFGATAVDYATVRVVSAEGDQSLTVSTGYFERDAVAWTRYLNELLLSKAIYMVTSKGHVPLLLTTSVLVTSDDDSSLLARTLVFQKANPQESYSQLPAAPAAQARAVAWRGYGFRHVLDSVGKRTGFGAPIRLRQYYTDDKTDVKPIIEKPNLPGDADYIKPTPVPATLAGTTPFPNDAINRAGTYKRTTCGSGYEGGVATIVIPQNTYGGENAGDANALAEARYRAINTQAYADAYGSCALSETYSWTVPAGQWHIRFSDPTHVAIYHNDGINGQADMGNTQSLQGQSATFIYPTPSNDLNFPVGDSFWNFYVFGAAGQAKKLSLYKNGQLLNSRQFSLNQDGYEHISLTSYNGVNTPIAQGDLWYIRYEDQ